jgi:hypothetical protein
LYIQAVVTMPKSSGGRSISKSFPVHGVQRCNNQQDTVHWRALKLDWSDHLHKANVRCQTLPKARRRLDDPSLDSHVSWRWSMCESASIESSHDTITVNSQGTLHLLRTSSAMAMRVNTAASLSARSFAGLSKCGLATRDLPHPNESHGIKQPTFPTTCTVLDFSQWFSSKAEAENKLLVWPKQKKTIS